MWSRLSVPRLERLQTPLPLCELFQVNAARLAPTFLIHSRSAFGSRAGTYTLVFLVLFGRGFVVYHQDAGEGANATGAPDVRTCSIVNAGDWFGRFVLIHLVELTRFGRKLFQGFDGPTGAETSRPQPAKGRGKVLFLG
jgi:hypothetical protein